MINYQPIKRLLLPIAKSITYLSLAVTVGCSNPLSSRFSEFDLKLRQEKSFRNDGFNYLVRLDRVHKTVDGWTAADLTVNGESHTFKYDGGDTPIEFVRRRLVNGRLMPNNTGFDNSDIFDVIEIKGTGTESSLDDAEKIDIFNVDDL